MQSSSQPWLFSSQSTSYSLDSSQLPSSSQLPYSSQASASTGSSNTMSINTGGPGPLNLNAPLHGADPNSPEVFKQNIQLAQGHVMRVQSLAQSALTQIQHAYQPGSNPLQAAADLSALKQSLYLLIDTLRQSGVGALPLYPPVAPISSSSSQPPSSNPNPSTSTSISPTHDPAAPDVPEDILIADATRAVQAEFERWKRIQESGAVVASLLHTMGAGGVDGASSGAGTGAVPVAGAGLAGSASQSASQGRR